MGEEFYRAIGIEGFRAFVNWYIGNTRLTREEKKSGKKVEYVAKPAPNDLLRFEVGTRIGEIVHFIIALINIGPLVVAVQQHFHGYIIFHCAFFVWGDFYLVSLAISPSPHLENRSEAARAHCSQREAQGSHRMSEKPRILVLSASTGNGHTSAADAIVAQAQAMGLHAVHEDVLDFTSKGFRKWYRGGYETLVRRRPKMWGHLYRTSDRPRFNYYFQTGLDKQFCRPLSKIIRSHKPDWVICTHSLPQPALARMRDQISFRMGVVVTDLYVHRMAPR
ncbi:MAG: hypothetical protein R2688_06955 [Fimbriimonadaceae bacterium]